MSLTFESVKEFHLHINAVSNPVSGEELDAEVVLG
jgi:hypothetical protein